MRLDFVFDTVCPWSFIGRRRLVRALGLRPTIDVDLRWRPFLLNPEMPAQGLDRALYLERKFGDSGHVRRLLSSAEEAGAREGIFFNFGIIERVPNTLNSHRLIQWAKGIATQNDLVERIFRAYFVEGLDIGDIDVLCRLAGDVGLSASLTRRYLASSEGADLVGADNLRIRRLGINGVPCFILDQRFAMAGAQDADMLARLMDIIRESERERIVG